MKTVHPVTDRLEPEPLDPEQVLFGNPKTSSLTLAEDGDGAESGLWRCTPGVVSDTEVEESFLVITGRGSVEFEDGSTIELRPGVTHRFAGGEKTKWTVEETVLKAYWIAGQV
ncbi:MAG TPA: cupin domain-containing protein [Solirubrobacterales bacterium]|nr:cupin domain-containing protein [Solirubrobacterales bacterium]